jgi:putative ABC transport system permease protein
MVRSSMPTAQVAASMRRALAEVDRDLPLALTRTMEAVLAEYVEEPKFSMLLLTIFAGVALVLASVGIYGVISYNVTQRSGEIGVRVALGAQRHDVVGLVVGQAMAMAATGVGFGILLALWGGKSLSSMLYGVGPRDPIVLASVSLFLLLVALAAAVAPAMRATRIDPTLAMRAD